MRVLRSLMRGRLGHYLVVSVDDRMPQIGRPQADGQLVGERDLVPRVEHEETQDREEPLTFSTRLNAWR